MWTHRCPDCLCACDCPGDSEHCCHDCDVPVEDGDGCDYDEDEVSF